MARKHKVVVKVNDVGEWYWIRKASNGRKSAESDVTFETAEHAEANARSTNVDVDAYTLDVEAPAPTIAVPATDEENVIASDYGTISPVSQAESPAGTNLS